MKKQRLLLIDSDGTIVVKPKDVQIDSFEKLCFAQGERIFDL